MPKRNAKPSRRRTAKAAAAKPRALGSIRIDYKVTGSGWAHAKVRSGSPIRTLETMVSDVGGAGLDGPLRATLELIEEHPTMSLTLENGEERESPASTWFYWADEPGVWKWTLTYVDRRTLNVQLRTSPTSEAPADDVPPQIEVNVDAAEWCEALLLLCERLLRRHGLTGYRASWNNADFPLGLYFRLLGYRHRGFRLGINRVWIGPQKSRLADEAAALKRLARARR